MDNDRTLLEFAEGHGLKPNFSCRSGNCSVHLVSGEVIYEKEPGVPIGQDEVLLCCAIPATNGNNKSVQIELEL